MSKISELGPIKGANTRSEDLFVIVNLIQGDDGTKNITRKELVQALQYEIFDRITITGGSISNVRLFNSQLYDNVIETSQFNNGTIDRSDITDGTMVGTDITAVTIANSAIDGSDFSNGTGNNNVFTNTIVDNGQLNNSTGNNNIFTNSTIDDSFYNNVTIEQGTANGLILTNITIDELVLEDAFISNSTIITTDFSNGTISDTVANTLTISESTFANGDIFDTDLDNVTITNSRFANGEVWATVVSNSEIYDTAISNSTIESTSANNITITNSDFSDGTGNNNVFTNTTVQGTLQDSVIANSSFTGTMDNVVAQNLQITSSSADGLSQTQSTFDSGNISRSTFEDGVIDQSQLVDFDMELHKVWEPNMDEDSYFAIKNAKTGQTEQITYRQFFNEISKSTEKALKVHVASDGDDKNPGTILKPVKTLKRAAELALEKAGGSYDRNDINNAVHISVGPGVYWVDEPVALPDDCSLSSTAGQYATLIRKKPGWERTNGILVGSGNYVQGFSYMDFEVDNFDYPEGGFAIAYRPGALIRRSPYLRDSSQLSNFNRLDVEPPLSPFNSKGTIADLGQEIFLEVGHSAQTLWEVDDEVTFSSGAKGFLSWNTDVDSDSRIYVRNLKGAVQPGDFVYSQRGGTGQVKELGIDDFPNRLVGRGGGCVLADRRVLDKDSLYTYVLTFGFTPRSQNGMGYVARDGAGINGIGSLSIFVRTAFYALNGGQMTLNNSGTQFGDISMRSKGSTTIIRPDNVNPALLLANAEFADTLEENIPAIVDDMIDYLTANTTSGGLGYQGYNADKCYRDTGILVDNTGYDVALNTNYWGRLSGITYQSPISYVVTNEQLTETVGSVTHLQEQLDYIFRNSNTEVSDRIARSLGETVNILNNGEPNASPITFADTGNVARTNARELIQDNKDLIIQGMVDWIDNNPEFFSYDSKKCARDIQEYILPAVKYDAMLDTNYNSVTAGNAYYFKQTRAVIENQREETVAAYERLRNETDKLIEVDSSVGAVRAYDRFNQIIDILGNNGAKFTPTNVTYDPATGEAVFTVGAHNLTVGRYINIAPASIIMSCETDGYVLEYAHPRVTDPAYNSALPILSVTDTSFTVNVGSTGYVGTHRFVKAEYDAVSVIGNEITFSDSDAIPADWKNARKLLQANKAFIQDAMMDWADANFFMYDSKKCQRDTQEYILPAIKRDMVTGTNFNAIQSGIAYRQGIASAVVDSQFTETVGAFTHLRDEVANTLTDPVAIARSNAAFNEFIGIMQIDGLEYTPTNATYDPVTGESVITIPSHGFEVGDMVLLAEESLTFSCANTSTGAIVQISHPRATDPAFESPVQITAATDDTITVFVGDAGGYTGTHNFVRAARNAVKQYVEVNAAWTPTDATYDPVTGICVITIGQHDIEVGDKIVLDKESITFECDSPAVQISHPRVTDPAFNSLTEVFAVTDTTISLFVGDAGGYTGAHTFVSATTNAVKTVNFPRGKFTPTNATYDPLTGLSTITIGKHELVAGDTVKIAQEALTFECGSPAELIAHPRATDPAFNKDLTILSTTSTTITVNVGDANGYTGAHTFVSAKPFAITVTTPYNGKLTPTDADYDPVTGDMVLTVGQHDLEVGKWISIAPESITLSCANTTTSVVTEITHPRAGDPAYKQPVRITGVTGTTITVNVGNAGGYAEPHTFVSATADCIDTNAIYWTDAAKIVKIYAPESATYDPATGNFVVTITGHDLTTDDHVEFKPNSFVFSCANTATGEVTTISNPRIGEPNYGMPLPITAADANTFTVNVGTANGYTGAHTFVSADADAVYKVTSTQQGVYARKQLRANKTFIQDEVDAWLRSNYFVYNKETCQRDTGLILDAVARDIITGSNVNSVFHGLAYRSGNASTDSVIANELTETVGALTWLKGEIASLIGGTDGNAAFDEIIDIMQNGTGAADTLTFGTRFASVEGNEARVLLQANKQFIIDETTSWINTNYPSLSYDSAKCERDIGYFVDSVSWDVQHGSNASTVLNSRMYYDNAVSILPEAERTPTAEAFEFVADLAAQIVRSEVFANTQSSSTQTLETNEAYTPTGATYDPVTGISVLTIGAHNLEVGDWIIMDEESITFSCANTSTGVVTNISHPRATDPAFNTPVEIIEVTTDSVKIQVGNAGGYQGIHTFVSAGANAVRKASNPAIAGKVKDLFSTVAYMVRANDFGALPAIVEPTAYTPEDPDFNTAVAAYNANLVYGSKPKYQTEIVDYIRETYNGLGYNTDLCYRDIGYIVDAISEDLEYGGNAGSINAASYYWDNALNILPLDQRQPTRLAYLHLGDVVENVIKGVAITPSAGNVTPQNTSGVAAGVDIAAQGKALATVIADLVDDEPVIEGYSGSTDEELRTPKSLPEVVGNPAMSPSRTFARKSLQRNKEFIQEEVIAFIADEYFVFESGKCARDTAYILDAVRRDVQTGSDYNAKIAGKAYRAGTVGTNVVVQKQLAETIEAVKWIQTDIESRLSGTALTRATTSFANLIDAMVNDYDAGTANYNFGTANVGSNNVNAKNGLQLNRTFLVAEGIAWTNVNHSGLSYDQAKCARDIGYMVDAVSYDIVHNSNVGIRDIARMYFENGLSNLPADQRIPTADLYIHLASVAERIVLKQVVTPSVGNGVAQNTVFGPVAGSVAQVVQDLWTILADVIRANTFDAAPAVKEAQTAAGAATGYDYEVEAAIIAGRVSTLATGVTDYLKAKYNYLEYNTAKCRRDVGYMVDAISHDIQYGGNSAMWNAAQIYFVNAVNLLPIEQREPTKRAFTHMGNIIWNIIRNETVVPSNGNTKVQDMSTQTARRYIATEAKDLAIMVANIADDNNPTNLPAKVEPLLDWVNVELQDAKQTIDRASDTLIEDMINFISREYRGLSYPKQTCRRDVGIIVDALSHDVQYQTNHATRLNANMYFDNAVSVLPYDQRTQTADFFARMASLVSNIVIGQEPGQDVSVGTSTLVEAEYTADLVRIIEESIRRNSLDAVPALVEPNMDWVEADLVTMAETIDNNLDVLSDDITTWINNEFNVLDYNKAKCYRDGHYLLDAFSHDLNYGGNAAARWNADFYFWNNVFRIPEDQRVPTGQAYRELGRLASLAVLGKLPGQVIRGDVATQAEADHAYELGLIFYNAFYNNDVKDLGPLVEPDFDFEDNAIFRFSKDIMRDNRQALQKEVQRFITATYKFIDLPKTKRDATNLIKFLANDFRYTNPTNGQEGDDQGVRTVVAALFDINSEHVFPIFNPSPLFNGWQDLRFKGTLQTTTQRDALTGMKRNDAYIIPTNWSGNRYDGVIHYWNGTAWATAGNNNVDLLESFYKAWEQIRDYIANNLAPDADHRNMVQGLFNEVLIASVLRPNFLTFGSLVESIAHQFNGASAGVNRNALPLNFRNLGAAISATASVLSEDGGRIRWSGADELNNQYFARGLRINGRTGRIEGRPFTSSVRKLARRASNSRAAL